MEITENGYLQETKGTVFFLYYYNYLVLLNIFYKMAVQLLSNLLFFLSSCYWSFVKWHLLMVMFVTFGTLMTYSEGHLSLFAALVAFLLPRHFKHNGSTCAATNSCAKIWIFLWYCIEEFAYNF